MMHMHLDLGFEMFLFITLGYLPAITWAILHFTRPTKKKTNLWAGADVWSWKDEAGKDCGMIGPGFHWKVPQGAKHGILQADGTTVWDHEEKP
jgi:hypothetical protein